MVSPRAEIESLRQLIPVEDDPLLLAVYDDVSNPQSLALASSQQSKAGQRLQRLRGLARSGHRGAMQGHSEAIRRPMKAARLQPNSGWNCGNAGRRDRL